MASSAILLGVAGVILAFASDVVLSASGAEVNRITLLAGQVTGALYFGFAMLNWMSKERLIGGIYNRPVAVANFSHFVIVALALVKLVSADPKAAPGIWVVSAIYVIFALLFGVILFRHPVDEASQAKAD